jgi:hypothetical protein
MTYNSDFGMTVQQDVISGYNLGPRTLTMALPLARFLEITDIANSAGVELDEIAQRALDRKHATSLAIYILKGLLHAVRDKLEPEEKDTSTCDHILKRMGDRCHYSLQPVVVNIPCPWEELAPQEIPDSSHRAWHISLPVGQVIWVVDGQHRRFGMHLVADFLKDVVNNRAYPSKGSLYPFEGLASELPTHELAVWREVHLATLGCTITMEAHLNLTVEEQRQLFHDLNNLGKKVAASVSFDFDNSNPLNNFIKDVLIDEGVLGAEVHEKDITDWAKHDGSIARKDVVAVSSILVLNKTNPRTATPLHVAQMEEIARQFWAKVGQIPYFGEDQAKLNTVAAQPVVLKALAKLTYDFARGRKANEDHLERVLEGMQLVDFSHQNPMWDYYDLEPAEREVKLPGLSAYMPDDDGNRDIGGRDEAGQMRFGAKHNDIFPIIGDMIRWRLGLPSRHAEIESVEAA